MNRKINWKKLIGQDRVKSTLSSSLESGNLGHAYLFSGEVGSGKFTAALELALAIHCDDENGAPCYECSSCRKIINNSSPDFRYMFPVLLRPEDKKRGEGTELSEEGWRRISEEIIERIDNPYAIQTAGMGNMPVDWIRELNRGMSRGSTSGKTNIAIISDIDTLAASSANAMLKTLEEPPPNTLFILLTSRLNSVLQTIRSRCQTIRFGAIPSEEIEQALALEFNTSQNDENVRSSASASQGYYGKAREIFADSDESKLLMEAANILNLCISTSSMDGIPTRLENMNASFFGNGQDRESAQEFFTLFIHIIRSLFFKLETGTENYIYQKCLKSTENIRLDIKSIEEITKVCESAKRDIGARANILLVLSTFIMSVMEIIHGKK